METPKDVLNELKWKEDRSISRAEIFYVHRGAEDDYRILKGDEVEELGRSFIKCEEGHIPYHRVFQIVYEGDVIFSRDRS